MSDLVGEGLALVVVGGRASGDRGVEDGNTVVSRSTGVRGGEGDIAEETRARTRCEADGVNVERVRTTLSEGVLPSGLLRRAWAGVVEPLANAHKSYEPLVQQGRK